jgi:preprotein translocase subunit SecA
MSQLLKGIPIIDWFVRITMGTKNQRDVKRYNKIVDAANALEPEIRRLTDAQLRAKTDEFRTRITGGEKPYAMIPEIFAVAREAMDRGVGIRSIFNPARNADLNQDGLVDANDRFDPSLLPADVRKLYDDTVAVIASTPARAPEGDLCGNAEPVPAWQFVDIPNAIYEAVRTIYPESRPPFRARPFDVQLIGGIVLAEGKIAEMKTGEGKTIVGPLACYLAACEKKQVHVVTVNDYLVQRDRDWTWPFFRALGLTVGAIHPQHMQGHEEKKAAYSCDVVYGTTSEFGFDYLRDNMKTRPEEQLQKRRGFAIVDEVDSILIDEARTPLIISGAAHASQPRYDIADQIARHLVNRQSDWQNAEAECQKLRERIAALDGDMRNARDKSSVPGMKSAQEAARKELATAEARRDRFKQFYEVELDKKQASLTHDGVEEAQRYAKTLDSRIGSFYVGDNIDLPHLVEQSVRAHTVYQRDRDYVVAADENGQQGVVIVDQNTGRKMVGRQWSDGLHQAVEAKEKVKIKEETQTMATITIQNYFKLYERLSGMTGTADTEATEFHEIYSLDVVSIPTNLPIARFDRHDRVYLSEKDKWNAIVEEIKLFHDVGRPVLVGTTSVEKSEKVSRMLQAKYQIQHEVLNAKQHEREAEIVLGAGNLGGVMIATNMAGRGTDIKLRRFTREELVEHWKRRNVAPREARADMPDDEITGLCYRHLAERSFGKDNTAGKDAPALRLMLLRKWAVERAKITEKKADSLSLEQLVELLDEVGYPPLHRLAMWSGVEAMGGLHIVGTERHESRRIDNQLRGRAGRQGDNGSSRFFLSMEDDLMKLFAGKAMLTALSTLGMKEGDDLEAGMLTRSIEKAQRKVEERNFQSRKNILEFDEPMEHQRRAFYGMRQPIVESRNVKETVLRYLEESIDKAAEDYLGTMHVPNTVAEWVRENCGVSIAAERFLKKDQEEIEKLIRIDAAEEAQESIRATAGECLPAELEPAEWDAENFAAWARTHYGAELLPQEIRSLGSEAAIERVQKAAIRKFAEVDLSPIGAFLVPGFGARQLAQWANRKFGANLDEQVFAGATTPAEAADKLIAKALEIYRQRELGYQIDFAIDSTNSALAQDPAGALAQFCGYVKARYGLDWNPTALPSNDPVELRRMLLDRAGAIGDADNAARVNACLARGRDADSIAQWFAEECLVRLSESERGEATADPDGFVRRKVADLVRLELTQFERWILLQILDNAWKDNLHSMDQIRDAIGFRAFSQKDPRIEFKRESARTFNEMQETIRDRVTDIAFRGRLAAQAPRPTPRPQAMPAAAAAGAVPLAAAQGGAPAMLAPSAAPAAAAPAAAPALGTGAPVDPSTLPVVGRNEPCPCGSGLKYRQCHGKKPDAQA